VLGWKDYPCILAEAAIAERLRPMDGITLHPTLFNTPLIDDEQGSETPLRESNEKLYIDSLEEISRQQVKPLRRCSSGHCRCFHQLQIGGRGLVS
jgi:hypothetical protein